MSDETLQDFAEMVNATNEGWGRAMGLRFVRATRSEIVAEMEIRPDHHQPYGIVHGGVHAGIIETLASVGAALHAIPLGKSVVGLENSTSFLRAVRSGKLIATAKPITTGRRTHVWEGEVRDEHGKLAATGRVRLLLLEPEAEIAGERVDVKGLKSA